MPKREDGQRRNGCSGLVCVFLLQHRGVSYAPGKQRTRHCLGKNRLCSIK